MIPLPKPLLAAAAALAALVPAAQAQSLDDVRVPAGHKLYLTAPAVGVQIYACNGQAWSFVAPRADLFDRRGRTIISHFAGPTWQYKDGSHVVGRAEIVAPAPGTIPWLRLAARSAAPGPDGDRLAKTTYIQRVNTTGGVIPAPETCNAQTAGTQAEVPYTADYRFWKATGRG